MSRPSDTEAEANRERNLALVLLFLVPALFSTNVITARAFSDFIPPSGLAF